MPSGGGSSAPTEQRVISTDLPEYVEPYFKRILRRGEAESLQPRQQFGAERLAYFSPDELTAQAMTRGYSQAGSPQELQQATQTVQGMPTGYQSGYSAPSFSPSRPPSRPPFRPPFMTPFRGGLGGFRPDDPINARPFPMQRFQSPMNSFMSAQRRQLPQQQPTIAPQKEPTPLPEGFSFERPTDGIYNMMMPSQGKRYAYGPEGKRIEVDDNRFGGQRPRQLSGSIGSILNARQPFQRGILPGMPPPQRSRFMPMPRPRPQPRSPYVPSYNKLPFEQGISRFISPYQQNVTDIAKRQAEAQSAAQGEQIAEQAARAGGLGGYREAILQAERQKNLGQRLDDIQTRGSQQAFDRAVGQVGAERAADLAGSQFDLSRLGQLEGARQAQERLRQSGFDLGNRAALSRASQLSNLGQQRQADNLARINALRQQGAQQRALRQAGLDMAYQDFLRQQDDTRGQIGFYSSLLRGVPVQANQTVSTMQQQPGLFQSLIGTGLGALGLYKGMS